jgi:hypothetical protein
VNAGAFEGVYYTVWCILQNLFLPKVLGGVPRKYILARTVPDRKTTDQLMQMVDDKKLNVVIDSEFSMEDALLVGVYGRWMLYGDANDS